VKQSTQTERTHQVVLARREGFYTADNEMVEVLAREIGVYAFAVYHVLKSRSWRGALPIGTRELAELLRISKDTAAKALRQLVDAGIAHEHVSTRRNEPSMYVLEHAKDVLERRRAAADTATADATTEIAPCPTSGTRVVEDATADVDARVLHQGHGGAHSVSAIRDASDLDQGRQRPRSGTRSNTEDLRRNTNTPLPPKGGETAKPASVRKRDALRAMVGAVTAVPVTAASRERRATSSAEVREGLVDAIGVVRQALDAMLYTHSSERDRETMLELYDETLGALRYESHEVLEGREGGVLITVTSPCPKQAMEQVKALEARLTPELGRRLGTSVMLRVIGSAEAAA
jgi:DNA-binding transcriptional regulator YhcF (GntR family)